MNKKIVSIGDFLILLARTEAYFNKKKWDARLKGKDWVTEKSEGEVIKIPKLKDILEK